jgi:hypothetical protein
MLSALCALTIAFHFAPLLAAAHSFHFVYNPSDLLQTMQTFNFLQNHSISMLLGYRLASKTPRCIRYSHKIASLYLIFVYKKSRDLVCIIFSYHCSKISEKILN